MATHILTRPISRGGSGGTGTGDVSVTMVNGQPTVTYIDTTRGDKVLSISEQIIIFSENRVRTLDWLDVGNTNGTIPGYIADFNGTVVYATGHCENAPSTKDFHLFINNTDVGSLGTLSGGVDALFVNTNINIDFNQSDKLRVRALDGTPGDIDGTIIKLTLKWRG
jgi:hypothetical protein